MKKFKLLAAAVLGISLLFVGCKTGVNPGNNENNNMENNTDNNQNNDGENGNSTNKKETKQILSFSVGGSKALAVVDEETDRSIARSVARNATTDSMIMKIMEDGSMESFMTVPEGFNGSISPINYIAQSPADDANEIYIVFHYRSNLWKDKYEERTDEWGNTWTEYVGNENIDIGQLICVSADGTYDDILQIDDGTWRDLYGSNKDSIAFDKQGYMYYLLNEWDGNENTNMIYRYDPKTKESIQLTAPVPGTYYEKFQVSDDGKWIFVKANRWTSTNTTSYLRVIPTANANKPVDIFYSSGNSGWIRDWIYDNRNNCLYYNLDGTLYSIPETNGEFSKDNRITLFSGNSNSWFNYNDIFEWKNGGSSNYDYRALNEVYGYWYNEDAKDYNWYSKYFYFRNPKTEEQEVVLDEVLAYLFAKVKDSYTSESYQVPSKYYYADNDDFKERTYVAFDEEETEGITYYKDTKFYHDENGSRVYVDYDAEESDDVEYQYEMMQTRYYDYAKLYDIKFDTFAEVEGYELLASVTEGKKNLEALKAISEAGLNSLFASLLESSRYARWGAGFYELYEHNFYDDVLYSKETGKKIDSSLLHHNSVNNLFFDRTGLNKWDLFDWVSSSSSNYDWKSEYTTTKTVTSGNGSIEKTIVDTEKVLKKLATYCKTSHIDFKLTAFKDDPTYKSLYTDAINEEALSFLDTPARIGLLIQFMDNNYDNNNCHGKFLSLTCFVEGTDDPAYDFKTNNSSSIWWGDVGNFTPSYGKSLYGTYGNNLVQIVDKEGKASGTYVNLMDDYKVVSTLIAENGFFFQNALLDKYEEESGAHQIHFYNVKDNSLQNLFINVQNNTELEIVTFCAAGDFVYYSAVYGTSVLNTKINIHTLEATPLNGSQKLSQIISVK